MTQPAQFSSGIELAPFVTSSVPLRRSWDVITSRYAGIISHEGKGLSWKVYKEPDSGLTIVAFEVMQDSSNLQADLVPSNALTEKNFRHFEFLCTKKAPHFSVNSTAFSLLYENYEKLDQLKSEISSSTPLIVTGHGLGGSVASLFTISLLDSIWLGKNRPLCITFGSPLIGDKMLQQAISRSTIWNSCFLHVVSLEDPLPRLFIANCSSSAAALTPPINTYMPFGTFLFCSDVNSTCFENPDSVLELLMTMGAIHVQSQRFQYADYGKIVKNLNHKAICKDLTTLAENMTRPESNFAVSISLQLRALGLTAHMQQKQNIDINTLENKMEVLERGFILSRKMKFSPMKLNMMKMIMAQLEWYKKHHKDSRTGYYDGYKDKKFKTDGDVVEFVKRLSNYWETMVEEAKIKPQKGGAAFRQSWLNAATSYRRMVEPFFIADYYGNGGKDYVTKNRPIHFVLLEEWFRNEMTKAKTSNEEAIRDWDWDSGWNWDWCRNVDEAIRSIQGSMVDEEWEYNSNIRSDYENEESISSTMCFSYRSRTNQLLLSSKELKVVEENEENLSTISKKNDKNNSCFEAGIDELLLSCQGSVLEENINKFELHVEEAVLSRQGSIAVRELELDLNRAKKKNVEALLTTDSCFWAHVEEARISCKELKVIKEKEEILKKLVEFVEYVYELLKNYEVSPEVFLPQSSYMRWWNEYKAIKGTSYDSKLASFMNDVGKYKQYALGKYDFL